ncbi:MAG: glycosyltransferase family 1 protein, partial [Rhodopirellula sp.]|nr:glycosyltransferase family 1 protein [Rhodopirellula sp.]
IGEPDPGNPSSVSQDEVDEWVLESNVSVLGFRSDIAYLFSNSNIVVLPSYYGEGLPKTLVEAAACGRAVVTSDMPGCRDAILPDLSGLLVPARDAESLADAIEYLLQRPDVRGEMGRTGRVLAEEKYSIVSVIDSHLEIYKGLGLINL